MRDLTIREWLENYNAGKYSDPDVDTQITAGWYDWFCSDKALAGKTKKLASKVKRIAKSAKVDLDNMYVFFKNNCPMNGSLYDDFRFCDLKTGNVIFTITPKSGHKCQNGAAEVWGKENDFEKPLVQGTWKDVLNFFGV